MTEFWRTVGMVSCAWVSGAAAATAYWTFQSARLYTLTPEAVREILDTSPGPSSQVSPLPELVRPCTICGTATTTYRAVSGPDGTALNAMLPCCSEHEVDFVADEVVHTEDGPLPPVAPYVGEDGEPGQGFQFRVVTRQKEGS